MSNTLTRRAALTIALQALVARATLAQAGAAPFNLARRPMPTGEAAADLLPAMVGPFRRDALPPYARVPGDGELHATYRRGADSVRFGVSVPGNAGAARAAIASAAQHTRDQLRRSGRQGDLPRIMQDLQGDPAYVAVGDFIAWSRGGYFFAARASSPHALSSFMQAFLY